MKRTLLLAGMLIGITVAPAMAMNVDDIIQLCNAGFEPDRVARIVEAAGVDEPLTASDWARIKTEGCGDEVVDALLNVLAPADVEEEDSEGTTYDSRRDNVNINLYGSWGTNGWYGSMFWGGYDPWWGIGYTWYDPWWDWNWRWRWAGTYWYDPWWHYPHHSGYYSHVWYDPFYYCGGNYIGGYYGGGVYYRQKAARQGGVAKSYRYAVAKSSPVVTKAVYASAKAKPYRAGVIATGMNTGSPVAYRKSSRMTVTTADGTVISRNKSTYARSKSGISTGAVKREGTSTTVRTSNGYAKRKTTVTHGGTTSTGKSTTITRSGTKTRTSSGTRNGSTTVKRKSPGATNTGKSSPGVAPSSGSKSSPSYRAPSTTSRHRSGSGGGTMTARPKGRK